MSKKYDLTGKIFGNLTVIKFSYINKYKKKVWECKCNCGNKKSVFATTGELNSGNTKSCGCIAKKRIAELNKKYKDEDFIGKTFGRLKVIRKSSVRKNGKIYWYCQCECGNYKDVQQQYLLNGRIKSCGCYASDKTIEFNKKTKKKYNTYDLTGEYGIGYTSKGEEFYFDLEDYNLIKDYCWNINKYGYVYANYNKKIIRMHRIIMNIDDPLIEIDHIDCHKKHDNRKINLRYANDTINNINKDLYSNNTSGVTGVYWNKNINKWCPAIRLNNKLTYLGSYNNFDDAVQARKEAEEKYFGKYSFDNLFNT